MSRFIKSIFVRDNFLNRLHSTIKKFLFVSFMLGLVS